jgi:hypothetical protein
MVRALYDVLKDAGKVPAETAKLHALTEFEKYRIVQDRLFESDSDLFAGRQLVEIVRHYREPHREPLAPVCLMAVRMVCNWLLLRSTRLEHSSVAWITRISYRQQQCSSFRKTGFQGLWNYAFSKTRYSYVMG